MTENCDVSTLISELNSENIALKFNIKRNTVSHYLNESIGQELVKINTRPVLFLNKMMFEKRFFPLSKCVYSSIKELFNEENKEVCGDNNVFSKMVGCNGSLKKPIEQIISSVFYPDNSLPILIYGPTGTGKSYMANLMFEFSVKNKVLPKDAPFYIFNCAQYANNPELLSSNLFGYVKGAFTGAVADTKGILEESDGGMLFLDEVHRLNGENQEKLFTFLDKGIFRRVGESDKWRKASIRIVMATTENINSSFLETFIRRIPIVVTLPSLEERGYEEKLQFIYMFFHRESKILNRKLVISGRVIDTLLYNTSKGNAGGLYSTIKYTCAKAYVKSKDKKDVYINLRNLPDDVINSTAAPNLSEDLKSRKILISPSKDYKKELTFKKDDVEELTSFFEEICYYYKKYCTGKIDPRLLEYFSFKAIKKIIDCFIISHNAKYEENMFGYILNIVEKALNDTALLYNLKFTSNNIYFISAYFHIRGSRKYKIKGKIKDEMLCEYKEKYYKEYIIANKILTLIYEDLEISIENEDKLLLTIFLASLGLDSDFDSIKPILLTYGDKTASRICDAVNIILKNNIFEGINVPIVHNIFEGTDVSLEQNKFEGLDTFTSPTVEAISERILKYTKDNDIRKGLLILSDIIPIKELYISLQKVITVPFVLINNTSANIAIKIGSYLLDNYDMEEIVRNIEEDNKIQYYVNYSGEKDKALLAICPTGLGVAQKLKNILKKSIPKEIDVKIIDYQYESIKDFDKQSMIFKQYDVIGAIGPINPNIVGIPFIYLHDITSENAGESINKMFETVASKNQIDTIINSLVISLSLKRLIGNITILDKDKLLYEISDSLDNYERLSNCKLNNRIRYNVYFHVSCLVERLIRNSPIDTCEDLERFIKTKGEEIELIKMAFSGIEDSYNIDIPITEIKYLYNLLKGK